MNAIDIYFNVYFNAIDFYVLKVCKAYIFITYQCECFLSVDKIYILNDQAHMVQIRRHYNSRLYKTSHSRQV